MKILTGTAYDFSVCSVCRQQWQNIDYACSRHQLTCGYPLPDPMPDHEDPRDEEETVFDRAAAEQCPAYVDPDHEYGPHSSGGKA